MSSNTLTGTLAAETITPGAIAAGIGLAERRELCGLLALLEITGLVEIAKGAVDAVYAKLGRDLPDMAHQLPLRADELASGPAPTEALRHRLWSELTSALGLAQVLPLSSRRMLETAAAMGVTSAEVLSPALNARRRAQEAAVVGEGRGERLGRNLAEIVRSPTSIFKSAPVYSFPDVVGSEAFALLDGLKAHGASESLDPEVRRAIEAGQAQAGWAAVGGGGWIAFAAAVQVAGFAPYILAAQISAFIPFMGGSTAVSLLAVLVNPITLIAGLATLGYFGVKGKADQVRRIAAARVSVILALRGMACVEDGVAELLSAFRRLPDLGPVALDHLAKADRDALRARIAGMEKRLLSKLPRAWSAPPGAWSAPVTARKVGEADLLAISTLTFGDLLYHAAAIDPKVLAAADFSRSIEIGDPLYLAAQIGLFLSDGARTSLRGYTAEQVVLSRFIEMGHAVELPDTSNMAGFDLLIDGAPVQVKCGVSDTILREHFDKYPEIPVVANSELAARADLLDPEFRHLVSSFDGFDLPAVQEMLDNALAGGAGVADADVPVFAMFVGAGRGAFRAWKGEIPVNDLPAWLVVDLTIRRALAAGGKVAGGYLGLLLIGPAGGIILAPLAGLVALAGIGKARNLAEQAMFREWHSSVMAKSDSLLAAVQIALTRRADALFVRAHDIASGSTAFPGDHAEWLFARAVDDAIAAAESLTDLQKPTNLNDVLELIYTAVRTASTDAMASAARVVVIQELSAKPRLGATIKEKIAPAARSE